MLNKEKSPPMLLQYAPHPCRVHDTFDSFSKRKKEPACRGPSTKVFGTLPRVLPAFYSTTRQSLNIGSPICLHCTLRCGFPLHSYDRTV